MSYLVPISQEQHDSLGWFVARGYFPDEVWSAMEPVNGGYEIPEHVAWLLLDAQDDEAFLTCMAPELAGVFIDLIQEIV